MEDFRFHMTLTGRLDGGRRKSVVTMLRDRFAAIGLASIAIDRIALFRQHDADSRFRILGHYDLKPA
jgi:2'-5' RNA ligase